MRSNDLTIRMSALAVAMAFVVGSVLVLGSYSNEKFRLAKAADEISVGAPPVEVAISPSHIEVIGVRSERTARDAATSKPQS